MEASGNMVQIFAFQLPSKSSTHSSEKNGSPSSLLHNAENCYPETTRCCLSSLSLTVTEQKNTPGEIQGP